MVRAGRRTRAAARHRRAPPGAHVPSAGSSGPVAGRSTRGARHIHPVAAAARDRTCQAADETFGRRTVDPTAGSGPGTGRQSMGGGRARRSRSGSVLPVRAAALPVRPWTAAGGRRTLNPSPAHTGRSAPLTARCPCRRSRVPIAPLLASTTRRPAPGTRQRATGELDDPAYVQAPPRPAGVRRQPCRAPAAGQGPASPDRRRRASTHRMARTCSTRVRGGSGAHPDFRSLDGARRGTPTTTSWQWPSFNLEYSRSMHPALRPPGQAQDDRRRRGGLAGARDPGERGRLQDAQRAPASIPAWSTTPASSGTAANNIAAAEQQHVNDLDEGWSLTGLRGQAGDQPGRRRGLVRG